MLIRGMNIPLIIACTTIVIALLIFPLIISYKAEKNKDQNEWDKIKKYGNKINNKTRKNK
jgi:hypothetical protein|tara:strand:- start:30 stop:209 length:180 start_codon:yes stop_codon:yes gene_type:complete